MYWRGRNRTIHAHIRSPGCLIRGRSLLHFLEQPGHPDMADRIEKPLAVGFDVELARLLLHPRPPVVLDLVICPSWEILRDFRPPVAPFVVKFKDHELFLRGEIPALDVGSQVIQPP